MVDHRSVIVRHPGRWPGANSVSPSARFEDRGINAYDHVRRWYQPLGGPMLVPVSMWYAALLEVAGVIGLMALFHDGMGASLGWSGFFAVATLAALWLTVWWLARRRLPDRVLRRTITRS